MDKFKRIAAIIGIALIAGLYLLSFVSSFFATEVSNGLFLASIFSAIVIPIVIWWMIVVYKWVHKKDNPVGTEDVTPSNEAGKKN